jgi:glycyl-tRNA synthetase beta chain
MAKQKLKVPKGESLLVELLTEELPPKSLKRLSEAFATALLQGLKDQYFVDAQAKAETFATPRRLAVRVSAVWAKQPDRAIERKGPSVQAGLDANGQPTPALLGFARSCGTDPKKLERRKDDKGEYFVFTAKQKGEPLAHHLAGLVEAALKKLPVAKLMRWGASDVQFVRPVHRLVMLHGTKVVPGTVLGLTSGNKTLGHRFLSKGFVVIKRAQDYEKVLRNQGKVTASFEERREAIVRELDKAAAKLAKGARWRMGKEMDLVDEVTAIVESPHCYVGSFDAAFLDVPRECLVVTMQQHQKYFPVADAKGKLLPRFLFVSNMQPTDPRNIVQGNERVLRARLSDAKFFFDQDRKQKLADRVPRLANVVYQNKLGSQLERVQRIVKLASKIATVVGADVTHAERAAFLAKADLVTDMVGEFPELQGIMGQYYARHDGESEAVCSAIRDQYRLRFDEADGENLVSACLYLADRVEALVGLFGVGQAPTGDKDPFALRRAALGVISVYENIASSGTARKAPLPDIRELLNVAESLYAPGVLQAGAVSQVYEFVFERYWNSLAALFPKTSVDAVIRKRPRLDEVKVRIAAVEAFRKLPESESLAAANKRIRNILRKSEAADGKLDETLLQEPAERALYEAIVGAEPGIAERLARQDYTGALSALAGLRGAVDTFFDKVLVNAEDARLRANRHAVLKRLDGLMNQVADISQLAA